MEHFFKNIQINNFKSIKNLGLNDCSRINLFIGRPNVGKSNILEALSLFSLPHVKFNTNKKLNNFIRVENESELFYDGNIKDIAIVKTDSLTAIVKYVPLSSKTLDVSLPFITGNKYKGWNFFISQNLKLLAQLTLNETLTLKEHITEYDSFLVKKYTFIPKVAYKQVNSLFLTPPFGINLLNCIDVNEKLKSELTQLFKEYGLKLVFDKASQSLKIMKDKKGDNIFLIPYNSIADTLQRIVFFKTAIASNQDSILLFEEPEAHSFPPYISLITQEIIHSTTNQFFITTHSPFIVSDFLENCRNELSVFAVNYVNGQTVAKKLTAHDLDEIYQNGVDLFTNIETYN